MLAEDQVQKLRIWVLALKSGRYKQARGRLRDELPTGGGDGFCCLGVMCDTENSESWERVEGETDGTTIVSGGYWQWLYDDNDYPYECFPPVPILDNYGLNQSDECEVDMSLDEWELRREALNAFVRTGNVGYLALANDHGSTFDDIADAIEAFIKKNQ